ncbi:MULTISPECIES: glutamate 5-kinase [Blastomonas]|jgi:glutamate 5-kinase|uniref:glutamate 5-kinase n=1 Tax=Blastomonas TaxID=150203 RepID=UPI00083E41BE|nr:MULTISPECIES: glutamate 5-kinase [Blastomonas]AOG00548.1 glutamate 5-kinase [Blastomonas sp. RAC04]MDM7929229.1 glutamate 5-kinase [Blastomonas fulva]MDM7965999.1 glutamate 5-kinase [Blastomonas fulva]
MTHAPSPAALLSAAACPVLVVKVGSALLVAPDGTVRREWLASLVDDIAARTSAGQRIVIVSSGAIALGARRLGLPKGGRASLEDAQAAAATGQIALSQCWAELLGDHAITAAQMLVTLDDLEDRRRFLNASATLRRLIALGVVPVINENDSVATEEIRFGDNDRLAARIAQAAGAGGVVLLSDVDGLYTANPKNDPDAKLVESVARIDARIRAMADGGSASGMGSGGMLSKLEAARIATSAGAHLAIANGTHDHPLARLAAGGRATVFTAGPQGKGRKLWLAGRMTARGRITVDAGAQAALAKGSSLLAAGATAVDGKFVRGDVIEILNASGETIARGLAEYDAGDAARIMGLRSDAIAEVLGYAPRSALVHRDQMVLL